MELLAPYLGLAASRLSAMLPHPFTAKGRQARYRYQLSILQIELSLTQVLDRPVSARIFSEEVIRENLDIRRPKTGSTNL